MGVCDVWFRILGVIDDRDGDGRARRAFQFCVRFAQYDGRTARGACRDQRPGDEHHDDDPRVDAAGYAAGECTCGIRGD